VLRWQRIVTNKFSWIRTSSLYKKPWRPLIHSISRRWEAVSRIESSREFQRIKDWGWTSKQMSRRIQIVCNSYSNPCLYDVWISNNSIHQSKPRLQVTNARDNTLEL
jgi:hypothetical protein